MTVSVRTRSLGNVPVSLGTLLHGFDEATARRLIAAGIVELSPEITGPATPASKTPRKGK